MKKILEKVGCTIACIGMFAMIVILARAKEELHKGFMEETTIATSQETIEIIEKASTESEVRTGITCIVSVGAAAVVDNLSDTAITICGWSDIFLTEEEMKLLYTTVYCEAGNQGYEAQVMVALVILNRLNSDKYPDTLREVVYQEGQFAVTKWPDFESKGWTSSVQSAVDYALQYNEYPRDMYYFRADYYHSFGEPYVYIAETYFSLEGGK